MIIDSHCHLTYEPMYSSLDETLKRAISNDVKLLLTISTVDKGFDNILKIVNEHKCVYGTYGIHPHEAKSHKLINKEYIVKKINLNKSILLLFDRNLITVSEEVLNILENILGIFSGCFSKTLRNTLSKK